MSDCDQGEEEYLVDKVGEKVSGVTVGEAVAVGGLDVLMSQSEPDYSL